ncbi:MAG: sigma-70 family RNA polymerase sigma factor [Clostridiales bacterium]|nr:sigma-70 family RNA polymerase sigma factor [Clostridiales bacterium]
MNSEEISFEQLYMQYYDAIYRHCYHKLELVHELAEDIATDVFTLLLSKWDEFEAHTEAVLVSWLYSAANNMIMNHFRRKKHFVTVEYDEAEITDAAAMSFDIDEGNSALDNEKYYEYLAQTRAALTEKERELFDCTYLKKLTIANTAEYLGIPENRVVVGRYRLKNKLKKIFSEIFQK